MIDGGDTRNEALKMYTIYTSRDTEERFVLYEQYTAYVLLVWYHTTAQHWHLT